MNTRQKTFEDRDTRMKTNLAKWKIETKPDPRVVRFSVLETKTPEERDEFIMNKLYELMGDDYYVASWQREEHTHPDYHNIVAILRLLSPEGNSIT